MTRKQNEPPLLISISLPLLGAAFTLFLVGLPNAWIFLSVGEKIRRSCGVEDAYISYFMVKANDTVKTDLLSEQGQGVIRGSVLRNGEGVASVKTQLLLKQNTPEGGVLQWSEIVSTNRKGKYSISLPFGSYKVVGYAARSPPSFNNRNNWTFELLYPDDVKRGKEVGLVVAEMSAKDAVSEGPDIRMHNR